MLGMDGVGDLALAPTPTPDVQFPESDDASSLCEGGPYISVLWVAIPGRDGVGDERLRVVDGVGPPRLVPAGFFAGSPLARK
jgi:hypothetical protein